ncbi:MAG: TraR/DksA family transcriptional regulator [Thermoanaerobaculia bacterium]
MNTDHYKERLTQLEKTLSERKKRALAGGRGQFIDSAHDSGDVSTAEVAADAEFTEAELDSTTLSLVQEALGRIANGTYGKCLADGARISTKRLEAVPWAAYCEKHQALIEAAAQPRNL